MSEANWTFPADLLSESIRIMRPHGAMGNEGLVLWFGSAVGDRLDITHAVEVYGSGFQTTPLHMQLSMRAMAALTDLADRLDRFLVGQIHSHPARMLELSDLDIDQGIRVPNYLSLVCPHYAQLDLADFHECGVHVFEQGNYRRLSFSEVTRRLRMRFDRTRNIRCEVHA